MRFLTPVVVLLALAALGVAAAIIWAGQTFRQFDEISAAGDLACTPVVGIAGAGDIEPLPGTGSAFLAAFDRRGGATRGEILLFDTDDPLDDASWRDRTGGVPAAFVPSGIDLYRAPLPDGRTLTRLFVVNLAGPEVVLFEVAEDGTLTVGERFADPRLVSPNDVVATGPRSFYVTNDTGSGRKSLKGKLDFLLGLKTGTIMHYDGNSWSVMDDGLAFPNGLALTEDGTALHVAEMRARRLVSYTRDASTDTIRRGGATALDNFPNNLSVTPEGDILVGTLPQPLATSAYGEGLRDLAASEIVSVSNGQARTLYRDPGEEISGVTMATRLGGKLLIGSRAADRFLMCDAGTGAGAGVGARTGPGAP